MAWPELSREFRRGNSLIDSHKLDWHVDRVRQWQVNPLKTYPIYVEISTAGGCNHRCIFCAVDYIGYVPNLFLPTEILIDRLQEMGEKGVKSIMYAGEGEPLLHRDIARITNATKAAGIDVSYTTNAVPLSKKIVDEALGSLSWIKASVDGGTPKTHAAIHRCPESHFPRLLKNLQYAVEVRNQKRFLCSIGAQLLLGRQNLKEVVLLGKILRDLGCDYYVVKPYSQHKKSLNQEDNYLQGLTYRECGYLVEELAAMETETFQVIFRQKAMESYTDPDRHYHICRATPNFWAYIMASGALYSCSAYLLDPRFLLGNIKETKFSDIWEGEIRRRHLEFVERELDISECRKNCRMHAVNVRLGQIADGLVSADNLQPEGSAPYNMNFI